MKLNIIGLPYLDPPLLSVIFGVLHGDEKNLAAIPDEPVRDYTAMLLSIARYNLKYRAVQLKKLVPVLDEMTNENESDPETTALELGLILAIKELYDMRPDTLKAVLRQVKIGT